MNSSALNILAGNFVLFVGEVGDVLDQEESVTVVLALWQSETKSQEIFRDDPGFYFLFTAGVRGEVLHVLVESSSHASSLLHAQFILNGKSTLASDR